MKLIKLIQDIFQLSKSAKKTTQLENVLCVTLKIEFKGIEKDLINNNFLTENYDRELYFNIYRSNRIPFLAAIIADAYLIDYADAFTLVLRAFHAAKEEIFKEVPVSNLVHFSRGLEK